MRRRLGLVALVWVVGVTSGSSQTAPVVRVLPPEALSVPLGASVDAEIRITVSEGFHVLANPAGYESLIPLTLKFESGGDLEVTEIRYPPGEPHRLRGLDEDLLVYGEALAVAVSVRASATSHEGAVAVPGQFRYQACDDHRCLFPATLTFDLKARVVPNGDP